MIYWKRSKYKLGWSDKKNSLQHKNMLLSSFDVVSDLWTGLKYKDWIASSPAVIMIKISIQPWIITFLLTRNHHELEALIFFWSDSFKSLSVCWVDIWLLVKPSKKLPLRKEINYIFNWQSRINYFYDKALFFMNGIVDLVYFPHSKNFIQCSSLSNLHQIFKYFPLLCGRDWP